MHCFVQNCIKNKQKVRNGIVCVFDFESYKTVAKSHFLYKKNSNLYKMETCLINIS